MKVLLVALALAGVLSLATAAPRDPRLKITLLVLNGGCPNSPKLRANLDTAIVGLHLKYQVVDLAKLKHGDPRSGFPAPTLLLNGKDMFGMPTPAPSDVRSCRYYPKGLPTSKEIRAKLVAAASG